MLKIKINFLKDTKPNYSLSFNSILAVVEYKRMHHFAPSLLVLCIFTLKTVLLYVVLHSNFEMYEYVI